MLSRISQQYVVLPFSKFFYIPELLELQKNSLVPD